MGHIQETTSAQARINLCNILPESIRLIDNGNKFKSILNFFVEKISK